MDSPGLIHGRSSRSVFVPEGGRQHLGLVAAALVLAGDIHYLVQQSKLQGDRVQP